MHRRGGQQLQSRETQNQRVLVEALKTLLSQKDTLLQTEGATGCWGRAKLPSGNTLVPSGWVISVGVGGATGQPAKRGHRGASRASSEGCPQKRNERSAKKIALKTL
eukprot:5450720-Amphidinium_carterae.1